MKKIVSLMLAFALLLSLGLTAFAADGAEKSESIDVTARYEKDTTEDVVFSVDIVWEDMTFSYSEEGTKVWNPENHSYTTTTEGGWDKTTADITVTNHSNAAVEVALNYTPAEGDTGITAALSVTSDTLQAGVEGAAAEADALVSTLTISGTPNASVTEEGVKIGSVTITVK